MVINETVNLTAIEIVKTISPIVSGNLLPLMNILKAAGIIFIAYLLLLIWQMITRFQDRRRLKRIEQKLDMLIEKSSKKRK